MNLAPAGSSKRYTKRNSVQIKITNIFRPKYKNSYCFFLNIYLMSFQHRHRLDFYSLNTPNFFLTGDRRPRNGKQSARPPTDWCCPSRRRPSVKATWARAHPLSQAPGTGPSAPCRISSPGPGPTTPHSPLWPSPCVRHRGCHCERRISCNKPSEVDRWSERGFGREATISWPKKFE